MFRKNPKCQAEEGCNKPATVEWTLDLPEGVDSLFLCEKHYQEKLKAREEAKRHAKAVEQKDKLIDIAKAFKVELDALDKDFSTIKEEILARLDKHEKAVTAEISKLQPLIQKLHDEPVVVNHDRYFKEINVEKGNGEIVTRYKEIEKPRDEVSPKSE
jgi:hypothetical protein